MSDAKVTEADRAAAVDAQYHFVGSRRLAYLTESDNAAIAEIIARAMQPERERAAKVRELLDAMAEFMRANWVEPCPPEGCEVCDMLRNYDALSAEKEPADE